ncbi:MAG: M23 family metallopeptidase [Saprospiraceae bacterium]
MPDENTAEKTLMERLKDNYRLVIMNNETFEEVGSYQLSLLNVYIILSSIVVSVALVVIALVIFTPVKRYIPGYGDINEHKELLALNKEISALEEELVAQKAYTDNFRKILVGDVQNETEISEEENIIDDSLLNVSRIKEDELLRKEVEFEEKINEKELTKSANFSPREMPLGQIFLFPPIKGEISAEFMMNGKHDGVDIMAPKNTPVKAVLDGYVIASDWTLETGNTIGIQHSNTLISFYKHNSSLLKKRGSFVKAGEAVAIIGNTGTLSDGPHLHFELWYKGKPVNPQEFINFD